MRSIFSEIREATRCVAEKARWVSVNETAVNEYPEKLLLSEKIILEHTEEHHLLGQGLDTIRFFVILDTINFGSGYFPYLDKDKNVSGYFTVARRLKTYCETCGVPSAEKLASIDKWACAEIFQQEIDNPHMDELMQFFALALKDLGLWSKKYFDGDLVEFLRRARTAEEAVKFLTRMTGFSDIEIYFGKRVPFLKRAQILLQDVKLAEPNSDLVQFEDLNELTVFADNILPYVFRADGILEYDEWLDNRIIREEIIGAGSVEEIELRSCAVYAAERIAEIIRDEMRNISVRELDYILWNRGQKLKKKTEYKRHRTRCVFY